jgi:hypothetical protein
MQYAQDFDGWTPGSVTYTGASNTSPGSSWPSTIFPYVKSGQLFACPSSGGGESIKSDIMPGSTRAYCDASTNGDEDTPAARTAGLVKVDSLSYWHESDTLQQLDNSQFQLLRFENRYMHPWAVWTKVGVC